LAATVPDWGIQEPNEWGKGLYKGKAECAIKNGKGVKKKKGGKDGSYGPELLKKRGDKLAYPSRRGKNRWR